MNRRRRVGDALYSLMGLKAVLYSRQHLLPRRQQNFLVLLLLALLHPRPGGGPGRPLPRLRLAQLPRPGEGRAGLRAEAGGAGGQEDAMKWGLVELHVDLNGISAPSQTDAVLGGIRRQGGRADLVRAALAHA